MSTRLSLTLYWTAVITVIVVVAGAAVFLLFQRQQSGRLDSALMEEADTATATIARLGPHIAHQMILRLSEERDIGANRRIWIAIRGDRIADAGDQRADLPMLKSAGVTRAIVDGRNHIYRYAIVPFSMDGNDAYLADGVDARAVREAIGRLRNSLLLMLPVLLITSVAVGYWLAGRALAPLVTVADTLAKIKPRDLSRRLPSSPIDDELGHLISAINSLLDRVERASATERRFAKDAAHELRTPLAVLRSEIEVALRRQRSASEYGRVLSSVLREATALGAMADDLLALTRLDQELSLSREPIDLCALTQEVVDAVEPLAASKCFIMEANLPTVARVQGNRDHLRRLIINLLDNAFTFTPEEGSIKISLESRDDLVRWRIADSGPGIAEADLPFIFNRFFRGQGSPAELGKGLGLSFCREIVQLHGGEITATNRPGGGAEFEVVLPAWPEA